MAVKFSGKWARNSETFGINFEADHNGQKIVCIVSQEALQNIGPGNATDSAENQFLANRSALEAIATKLIEQGAATDCQVHINSDNVSN